MTHTMMRNVNAVPTRSSRAVAVGCAGALALAVLSAACADKGVTPPRAAGSTKFSMVVTTIASQQASLTPRWLLVAALYKTAPRDSGGNSGRNGGGNGGGGDSIQPLALKWAHLASGTQQVTLDVDISTCLNDKNRGGSKDACTMYIAAAIEADSFDVTSDTSNHDPLAEAFDYYFPNTSFDVAPGHAPTIPPIDLSESRFGVIRWEGDEAFRAGGAFAPQTISGGISGAVTGTGAPTLFVPTIGYDLSLLASNQPLPPVSPQLAIQQGGTWRRVTATSAPTARPGSSFGFTDVTALSASEVYMGYWGGLFKYDGTGITRISAVNDSISSVSSVTTSGAGGSAKFVIAGTLSGGVWIGNTQTWQRYSVPTTQRVDGVCITGPTEAFAASSGSSGGVWRFDGTTWTSVQPPSGGAKYSLQCTAPGAAYVVANGGPIFKWNGSTWVALPNTGLGTGRTYALGAVSPTEVYAVGDATATDRVFYEFDGTAWHEVGRTSFTQSFGIGPWFRMWTDPRGGAAYYPSNFARLERVTPSGVSVLSYEPALRDIAMTSTSSAFAVGWNLFLARWDGAKWTVDAPPAGTPTVRILQGVWSDGPTNAWAAGNSSTILHYNGTGWSVVSDIFHPIAGSDNYNAVWGSGSDVWMAGDNTILHCRSVSTCSTEPTGGSGPLLGIWGSSASNVYAVGAGGRIVHYNGTSWGAVASPTTRELVRISGSAPDDIWAVGDSVLLRFDGTQWSNIPMTGDLRGMQTHAPALQQAEFQIGLWVRGPREAYLGSDFGNIARWDGTRWQQLGDPQYRRRILGIAGLAGGCGLLITDTQSDSPAAQLWRGIGPTGCFASPMASPTSWP